MVEAGLWSLVVFLWGAEPHCAQAFEVGGRGESGLLGAVGVCTPQKAHLEKELNCVMDGTLDRMVEESVLGSSPFVPLK